MNIQDYTITSRMKSALQYGDARFDKFVIKTKFGDDKVFGFVCKHLAVSDATSNLHHESKRFHSSSAYVVTHLKTGLAFWGFEAFHVACNFALDVESTFGDGLNDLSSDISVNAKRQDIAKYLKSRGMHKCQQYYLPITKAA